MQKLTLSLLLLAVLFLGACKKDMLHFNKVVQLNSYSDTDRLNKVVFTDALHGFIVGGNWYKDAVILSTADGGNTWQRQSYPNVGQLLFSATVAPNGGVYAAGFEGKLMHTTDFGSPWAYNQLEHYWFRDIAFTDAEHAIVVGGISFGSGRRQYIDSAGNILKTDTLSYQLNQIKMVDAKVGYICGFGIVLKTTDGGINWVIQDVKDDNFMAMDIHGNEIWMCGNIGCIFHTTDGGANWKQLRNGNDITQAKYRLLDIKFIDTLHGWAVGEKGVVIFTEDGGKHWMEYDHFTNNMLTSIAICADGRLLVTGDHGSIYKLTP